MIDSFTTAVGGDAQQRHSGRSVLIKLTSEFAKPTFNIMNSLIISTLILAQ